MRLLESFPPERTDAPRHAFAFKPNPRIDDALADPGAGAMPTLIRCGRQTARNTTGRAAV